MTVCSGADCARRYNIYGRDNDLTAAFSDVQRFIRCAHRMILFWLLTFSPSNIGGVLH